MAQAQLLRAVSRLVASIALATIAAGAALGGALAQDAGSGLDLEAIRARAKTETGEAEALAASARERARALTGEATGNAEAGRANGRAYAAEARRASPSRNQAFDFDRMVADAGDMAKADLGAAPRFVAFASTAMPPGALRAMINDVPRAGGVVVFRGLTRGSARAMTQALSKALAPGEQREGVGIDPRLFRAFKIDAVPAYVVAASDFDLCDGFDCVSQVPPHDRLSGNVTASFALETFARGGGPGARIAAQHLARLERAAP